MGESLDSLRMAERLSILMGQQKQHDIPSCVILFFLLLLFFCVVVTVAGVKCVKHSHIRCRSQADWISVCFQLHLLVKISTILFIFIFFSFIHSFIHSGFSIFSYRRGILHVLAWREVAQFRLLAAAIKKKLDKAIGMACVELASQETPSYAAILFPFLLFE